MVRRRLLLTLLFLEAVGLHRTWDLRGYTADGLALLTGRTREDLAAAAITARAVAGSDAACVETAELFLAFLGGFAGNLALTLGSQGGVYIAGGIVPRFGAAFTQTAFRERFEAKGRLRLYLAAIPTYVVTHKLPAFLGCAAALAD